MWATLRARLVLPHGIGKEFPPSAKKERQRRFDGGQTLDICSIPHGIIANLTRECRGNVHDQGVVDVT
jgi:hypothetical protein